MTPKPPLPHKGAGRVGFLANREEIAAMLAAGHPNITIYEAFSDRLGISYSQFNRYVARHIGTTDQHQTESRDGRRNPSASVSPPPQSGRGRGQTSGAGMVEESRSPAINPGGDKPASRFFDAQASKRKDLI